MNTKTFLELLAEILLFVVTHHLSYGMICRLVTISHLTLLEKNISEEL